MEIHLDNRLPPIELYQKTLEELPVGIVVGIDGFTYLKGVDCFIEIDANGHFKTNKDYFNEYISKKRPRVIYGFLYQTI